jgi:hypothetical protein
MLELHLAGRDDRITGFRRQAEHRRELTGEISEVIAGGAALCDPDAVARRDRRGCRHAKQPQQRLGDFDMASDAGLATRRRPTPSNHFTTTSPTSNIER